MPWRTWQQPGRRSICAVVWPLLGLVRAIMPARYTPAEVAVHNTHTDCWVSFLGRVFDLTKLVSENEGVLTQPIVASAGTDISHWFNPKTGDVRA